MLKKKDLFVAILSAKTQERKKHPAEATEGILCIFDPQCLDPIGFKSKVNVFLLITGYHSHSNMIGLEDVLLMTRDAKVTCDNPSHYSCGWGSNPIFFLEDQGFTIWFE